MKFRPVNINSRAARMFLRDGFCWHISSEDRRVRCSFFSRSNPSFAGGCKNFRGENFLARCGTATAPAGPLCQQFARA
jgi:hypothetical protein